MPVSTEHRKTTEQRYEYLLWILWVHGAGNAASITALIKAHDEAKRRKWPIATWVYARNTPYEGGTHQMLRAIEKRGWITSVTRDGSRLYEWNREKMLPRTHALEVLTMRRQGMDNAEIAGVLQLRTSGLVSAIYNDPFGLREKERKRLYCPGCGARKHEDQTVCVNCIAKRQDAEDDAAEALLPDAVWARSLRVPFPIDFEVTERHERFLVLHTERGTVRSRLVRGQTWEHALMEHGCLSR